MTRTDYLEKRCTHREYYAQFVNQKTLLVVQRHIGLTRLQQCNPDNHLNEIHLAVWDALPHWCNPLAPAGDYLTAAGWVCIAKEAARQLLEGATVELQPEDTQRAASLSGAIGTTGELIALTKKKLDTLRKLKTTMERERNLYP